MKAIHSKSKKRGDLVLLGGQILFGETDNSSIFHLLSGEVVILCNGQIVDLVEAGEVIDAAIWNSGTAVAWTDCVLQTVNIHPQVNPRFIPAEALNQHLALAA